LSALLSASGSGTLGGKGAGGGGGGGGISSSSSCSSAGGAGAGGAGGGAEGVEAPYPNDFVPVLLAEIDTLPIAIDSQNSHIRVSPSS
jgi:hypothetical protein